MTDETGAARVRELEAELERYKAMVADIAKGLDPVRVMTEGMGFVFELQQRLAEVEREAQWQRERHEQGVVAHAEQVRELMQSLDVAAKGIVRLESERDTLQCENAELRRDKESAYKQGVEDAHRCEQRHARIDQLERENQELKQSNREMLEWFTKMRKAAGGHDDTMGEAVERVAKLERENAELAAVRACLSGLKITPEQIRQALDDLGPTRDRAEAYVQVATETLIRIMQALAGRRGEDNGTN